MTPARVSAWCFGSRGSCGSLVRCNEPSMNRSPDLQLDAAPPTELLRSMTRTLRPARARIAPAVKPPRPAPITTTSKRAIQPRIPQALAQMRLVHCRYGAACQMRQCMERMRAEPALRIDGACCAKADTGFAIGIRANDWKLRYFQADLSASQRWALNSFASALTEPLSSFASPSSSALASSARLSFAPAVSSVVDMTGLPIHSISRSVAPGLSGATRATTSMVSVRPSAGNIWLGRLNVNFSLPVVALHAAAAGFAASVFDSTPATAAASLSLLSLSPSRQSAAAKRIERSMSTTPLVQPAATTPDNDFDFAISAAA